MSYSNSTNSDLTQEEWKELVALKKQINQNPAAVHPDKMELFTELLVRSWDAKCEPPDTTIWRKGHPMEE
jgi:hypothetical protein